VSTLFQGLLGRPADSPGLSYWTNLLNTGAPRTQVAQGILNSTESRGREVQILYQALLGRAADPQGLGFWLQNSMNLEQVQAGLLGSDEFLARSGGTPEGFLTAVYRDVLGRAPGAGGLRNWEGVLGRGVPRTTVAQTIGTSAEADQVRVADFYVQVLGRPADAGGLAYWSGALQGGARQSAVVAGLAGSDEFFTQMSASGAAGGQADPNAAAAQFLAGTGRFGAAPAGVDQLDRNAVTVPVFSALPSAASPAATTAASPGGQTAPNQATSPALVSAAIDLGTAATNTATNTPTQTGQGPPSSVAPGTPGAPGPGSATFGATGYGYPVNGAANPTGLGYGFPSYGDYNYGSLGSGIAGFPENF
jgi:hypothetical protein